MLFFYNAPANFVPNMQNNQRSSFDDVKMT